LEDYFIEPKILNKTRAFKAIEILLTIYSFISTLSYIIILIKSKVSITTFVNTKILFIVSLILSILPLVSAILIFTKKRFGWFSAAFIIIYHLLVRGFVILKLWLDLGFYSSTPALIILPTVLLFALLIWIMFLLFSKNIITIFSITKRQKFTVSILACSVFIFVNFFLQKIISQF
jgi:hypothetical protein